MINEKKKPKEISLFLILTNLSSTDITVLVQTKDMTATGMKPIVCNIF